MSVSIVIKVLDSHCKHWAKIVRAGGALPMPHAADRACDIPAVYTKTGDEEIFDGDFVFSGEQAHHRKTRGYNYKLIFCFNDVAYKIYPKSDLKANLKAAGLAPELLAGAGELAACVRAAHAINASEIFAKMVIKHATII